MLKEIINNLFYAIVFGILIWLEKVMVELAVKYGNIRLTENNSYNLGAWGLSIIVGVILAVMIWKLTRQVITDLPWVMPLYQKIVGFFKSRPEIGKWTLRIAMIIVGLHLIMSGILLWFTSNGIWPDCPHGTGSLTCVPKIVTVWQIFPLTTISIEMFLWSVGFVGGYEMIGVTSLLFVYSGVILIFSQIFRFRKSTWYIALFILALVEMAWYAFFMFTSRSDEALAGLLGFLALAIVTMLFTLHEKTNEIIKDISK